MTDVDWSQFEPVADSDTSADTQSQFASLASAFPDARISSLTRSAEHNADVGGMPTSQHIPRGGNAFGTAMDVVVPKDQRDDFKAHAADLGLQAIDEGTHIHLQLPRSARNVNWDKFQPVDDNTSSSGVDWSQFSPATDFAGVKSGSTSAPSFGDVQSGSSAAAADQSPDIFDQFTGAAKDLINHIPSQEGLMEAATNLESQGYAIPAGGIARLGVDVADALIPEALRPIPLPTADEAQQAVTQGLTYQPESESGKQATELASYPFEKLAEGGQYLGDKTLEATGSPALAAGVYTATQLVPFAVAHKIGEGILAAPDAIHAAAEARINAADAGKPVWDGTKDALDAIQSTVENKSKSPVQPEAPSTDIGQAVDLGQRAAEAPPEIPLTDHEQAAQNAWTGFTPATDEDIQNAAGKPVEAPTERSTVLDDGTQPKAEETSPGASGAALEGFDDLVPATRPLEGTSEAPKTEPLNPQQILEASKQSNGYLKDVGDRLGGLDVPIQKFDATEHASDLAAFPNVHPDKALGYYEPGQDVIRMHGDVPKGHTLLHETVHALTSRALHNGEQGKLTGDAGQAYQQLSALFDATNEHLRTTGEVKPVTNAAGQTGLSHYGFTDLHEFMAEFFANGTFRKMLKNTKLDDMPQSTIGALGRMAVAKVKNVYDAVVSNVRSVLGLPPKAESAMDALFAAQHQFLGSLSRSDRLMGKERAAPSPMAATRLSKDTIDQNAKTALDRGASPDAVARRVKDLYAEHGHEDTVGLANAKVEEERRLKGQDELEVQMGREFGSDIAKNASQKLKDDPTAGQSLAQAIINDPKRPTSNYEQALLLTERTRLNNEVNATHAAIDAAMKSGDRGSEMVQRAKLEDLRQASDRADKATRLSGTSAGKALQFRQMQMKQDYTLAAVEQKARVAAGEKGVDAASQAKIKDLTSRIAELDKKLAEKESNRINAQRKQVPRGDKVKLDNHFQTLVDRLKAIRQSEHMICG